jgi:8-oxo-dGTP pyrophosphatase MutT (NUDIX family)
MEKKEKKIWKVYHHDWGTFEMEWSEDTDFEKLQNVIGAQGFIFDNSGKLCITKLSVKKEWMILGGKPEKTDRSFEETLIREADEEADVDITDIKRLGYTVSYMKNPDRREISLRYVARIKKIKPQTIDPAYNEMPQRKFIFPEEFNQHCLWGEFGDFQLKKAIDALNKK